MKRDRSEPQLISSSNQLSHSNEIQSQKKEQREVVEVCSIRSSSSSQPYLNKSAHPNKQCRSIQILIGQFHKIMISIQRGSSENEHLIQGVMLHARSRLTLQDCLNIRYTNKLCYILKRYKFRDQKIKIEVQSEIGRIVSLIRAQTSNYDRITEMVASVQKKFIEIEKCAEV